MRFISHKRYIYIAETSLDNAAFLEIHCLCTHEEILKLAESHYLKFNLPYLDGFDKRRISTKNKDDGDEYEVEEIVDFITIRGNSFYYIKWKNFDENYNTWEPLRNLHHCKPLRKLFHKKHDTHIIIERLYNYFLDHDIKIKNLSFSYLKKKFHIPSKFPSNLLELSHFVMHQIALKRWEDQINNIIGHSQIIIDNEIDYDDPPNDFIFINDYIPGINVSIINEPPLGCSCPNNCEPTIKNDVSDSESPNTTIKNFTRKKNKLCCSFMSGINFPYNKLGRVMLKAGVPIYECNKLCSCDLNLCQSRVVQKGNGKLRFSIYKTKDKGWGVKSLQKIYKNTFVMEYVGEVITNEEAEQRGKEYDSNGMTYLFDLDFCDENNAFTIDAGRYGNIAHFVNHSCDPNLVVYAVYINNLDIRMPRIALFARRDIEKDEEITFDYLNSANNHYSSSTDGTQNLKFGVRSPASKKSILAVCSNSQTDMVRVNTSLATSLFKFKDISQLNLLTPPSSSLGTVENPNTEFESGITLEPLDVKPDISQMFLKNEDSIQFLDNMDVGDFENQNNENLPNKQAKHYSDNLISNNIIKKIKIEDHLEGLTSINSKISRILCKCKSKDCRKYIF